MNTIEMIEVVKAYIYHRTLEEVEIRQPRSLFEAVQLKQAYDIAYNWFRQNGSIVLK